jgi:hypothetical protein
MYAKLPTGIFVKTNIFIIIIIYFSNHFVEVLLFTRIQHLVTILHGWAPYVLFFPKKRSVRLLNSGYVTHEHNFECPCEYMTPRVAYLFAFISSHVPFFSSFHVALYITLKNNETQCFIHVLYDVRNG